MRVRWRHTDGRLMITHDEYRDGYWPPGYGGSWRPLATFPYGHPLYNFTWARLARATVPNLTDAEWFGPPGGEPDGWTLEESI